MASQILGDSPSCTTLEKKRQGWKGDGFTIVNPRLQAIMLPVMGCGAGNSGEAGMASQILGDSPSCTTLEEKRQGWKGDGFTIVSPRLQAIMLPVMGCGAGNSGEGP
ncbi:hypothetical protein ACOMHN_067313 [Nucella lapillus]